VSSTHLGPKARYLLLSVADLLIWGALSDKKTALSFTIAAGPRQCSHSRVRVKRGSWPFFFGVSDSRLSQRGRPDPGTGGPSYTPRHWVRFSSPPTTAGLKLKPYFCQVIYTNPAHTSQETHYVSATKPDRLMLFRETAAVYCENHT
jgi:hypothetical protein